MVTRKQQKRHRLVLANASRTIPQHFMDAIYLVKKMNK